MALLLIIPWTFFGGLFLFILAITTDLWFSHCSDLHSFFYPWYIYQHTKTNYFGTAILTIIINLVCPLWAILAWLYFFCTVGRDKSDRKKKNMII